VGQRWGSAAGGGRRGTVRGAAWEAAGVSGWSRELTRLSVAASHSCSKQASGSPAAQPRQPASSAPAGEGVQRATYTGKGGSCGSTGGLSWHRGVKTWGCVCAVLASFSGCEDPRLLALGWSRGQAGGGGEANSRSQSRFLLPALGCPCPVPQGQGDGEGSHWSLLDFQFSLSSSLAFSA